jgi:hypothetical protein
MQQLTLPLLFTLSAFVPIQHSCRFGREEFNDPLFLDQSHSHPLMTLFFTLVFAIKSAVSSGINSGNDGKMTGWP